MANKDQDEVNSYTKGWDRHEVYVLNALQELKDSQKEFKVEVQDIKDAVAEVAKNVAALHGKFDQYNNFNQRLFQFDAALIEKQKELAILRDKLSAQEKETGGLKVRIGLIVAGVAIVVTSLLNIIIPKLIGS